VRCALVVSALAACAPARMTVPRSQGVAIGTVTLSLSNVHVMFGEHPLLVDTGSPGDLVDLRRGLRDLGVRLADIKCAVVTHGHADHAGNARALQKLGIKIIAGEGDMWRELAGVHGHLTSTGVFAVFLKLIIPGHYDAFWPDIRVAGEYDLHDCGVDAKVIAMPGHTRGSVVVIAGKVALVGDLFRGGLVTAGEPKEHFYQDDLALAHQRIHELLARGIEVFVLGHAGPATRADVIRVFGTH